MKPIGPLMREHRLIERMVALLDKELESITEGKPADVGFLLTAVDFFRTYSDRTHHGKEEDILFRELAKKPLQAEHKRIMDELIQEHATSRNLVARLADAAGSYGKEDVRSNEEIKYCLKELGQLYPAHIGKEDQHFFFPILEYFSKAEQDAMLEEFWEFDRMLIHEKYMKVVEGIEGRV